MRRTITVQLVVNGVESFVDQVTDNITETLESWQNTGDITEVINMEIEDEDD